MALHEILREIGGDEQFCLVHLPYLICHGIYNAIHLITFLVRFY